MHWALFTILGMQKLLKMRKLLLLSLLASCSYKTIPLKGSYLEKPYSIETSTSSDKVWDKLIDLFAQKGLSIKIIDRASGLIISERAAFGYTTEDKNGKLKDPTAFIVVPQMYNPGNRMTIPVCENLVAEWNVRIKTQGDKTLINVNVVNVVRNVSGVYLANNSCPQAKSTGVFERIIADAIK